MAEFSDIIGQEQIKEHMQNALKTGKISHAYIISGENGSGKEFIAKIFAKTIQCEEKEDRNGFIEACNKCHSCIQAESDNHPDIITITHEKPASIGVNDIRDKLRDDVVIKPYASEHKIYIIPEGEKMTPAAQNALLKTLEEPPSYIVIIILTNNINAFLPTITSRCIHLSIKPVQDDLIRQYLMEECHVVDYKAALCASFAKGNVGKALQLASNEKFEALKNATIELISKLKGLEIHDMMDRVHEILSPDEDDEKNSKNGIDISQLEDFLDVLLFLFRDILVYKATNEEEHLIFSDKLSYIKDVTQNCTYDAINRIIGNMEIAKNRISSNVNIDLALELMLIGIKETLWQE
ncbi:DNA polymerase III subunit [Butyrivibrio sp. YAB3001]|uniref:DNA polymerase III subunit n=1 Tax=Butyrivibrio sp. YAB3001 TaxID=1520812 RepID=UPI0008F64C65|nr:DNA polymerase III subunit delta' C-terminal domain-containing protein [Butyrivibrio sp. YAB3001]SFC64352.1 DNA polymerase-3 subunit delta' [Butyrivibrio sp. YAB3001]